jgi:hypothetical protein
MCLLLHSTHLLLHSAHVLLLQASSSGLPPSTQTTSRGNRTLEAASKTEQGSCVFLFFFRELRRGPCSRAAHSNHCFTCSYYNRPFASLSKVRVKALVSVVGSRWSGWLHPCKGRRVVWFVACSYVFRRSGARTHRGYALTAQGVHVICFRQRLRCGLHSPASTTAIEVPHREGVRIPREEKKTATAKKTGHGCWRNFDIALV